MLRIYIALASVLLCWTGLYGQDNKIFGSVTDHNNAPLPAAHISIAGTTLGTLSQANGSFSINSLPPGKYIVNVHYSGYGTKNGTIQIPSDEPLVFQLQPVVYDINQVVVTGTRSPKALKDSPVLTQVLSASTMAKTDLTDIIQALEVSVPGIEFSQGAYGSNITMMGLPGNYVLFLRDGNRLAGENNANIDYNRLTMINTNRIEIVRGASSVLYGSNAMAGVINLISRPPIKPASLELFTRQTAPNTNITETAVALSNNKMAARSTYKYNHTDGYDLNNDRSDGHTMEKTTTHQLSQLLSWSPSHDFNLVANGSIYRNHVDASLPMRNNKMNDNLEMALKARYHINPNNSLEAVWHEDNYRIYEKEDRDRSLQYDNHFRNGKLLGNLKIADHSVLSWGTEYQHEGLLAPRNKIDQRMNNYDWVAYLHEALKVNDQLTLTGGLRYNYNSDYGQHTTWQTSAMLKTGKVTFRGNLGTGYKAPTLKERHMEYQAPTAFPIFVYGNPYLMPETSLYTGLSAEFAFSRLNFSLHAYQNAVKDMIVEVMEPYNSQENPAMIYYYQNIKDVNIRGIDLLFHWQPMNNLSVNGDYGYNYAEDQKQDRQLTGSRQHSGRLNLHYNLSALFAPSINLQGNYFGQMSRSIYDPFTGDESITYLSDYSLWKVHVGLKPIDQVTLQAGIDNLFDYTDTQTFA
ncbi:MAG: TonB-dependent receptor, partial [Bacteroidales bacterium]|nr:TonB-dependent receptor [Bacteroidales bacterium]